MSLFEQIARLHPELTATRSQRLLHPSSRINSIKNLPTTSSSSPRAHFSRVLVLVLSSLSEVSKSQILLLVRLARISDFALSYERMTMVVVVHDRALYIIRDMEHVDTCADGHILELR